MVDIVKMIYGKVVVFFKMLNSRIENRAGFKKILNNIGWLFFDKFLKLGLALFVGLWIARYLGPEQFGTYNYAAAFVALFSALATLGIDNIVIRNIVNHPEQTDVVLGSAFATKLFGGTLVFIAASISILFVRPNNMVIFLLVLLFASGTLFQSLNTVNFYFQAKVQSKFTVISMNSASLIAAVVKIIWLLKHGSLVGFAVITLLESILCNVFLLIMYHAKSQSVWKWKPNLKVVKSTLKESWPLALAGAASILNMRIDQVFIGNMLNDTVVGNYSAAVRIAELWLMLPAILGMSIYPSIIAAKKQSEKLYRSRLHKISLGMCIFTFPVALLITCFSHQIVTLLFGNQYAGAASILSIYIWTGVPYLVTFIYGQMYYLEGLTKVAFYVSLFVPVSNIILNFILIPRLGGSGAAIATLITTVGASIISLLILESKTGIFSIPAKNYT
jgi:PST family polysaccharide transporter